MTRYSVWLLPPPDAEAAFRAAKTVADAALGGLDFDLHLTVAGAFDMDPAQLLAVCRAETGRLRERGEGSVEVAPTCTSIGETYFQSLFVRAEVSDNLRALRAAIYAAAGDADPGFEPHISLYYGTAPRDRKIILLPDLPPAPTPFRSDRFALASNARAPTAWDIIEYF